MLNKQVKTLPICFTGLYFPKQMPHKWISDLFHKLIDSQAPHLPAYAARGFYEERGTQKLFRIDPTGPFLCAVSAMPISMTNQEKQLFKFEGPIYSYYWQDNQTGYLTQIITL